MINLGCTGSRNGMTPVQRLNMGDYFASIIKEPGHKILRQGCCTGVDEELTLIAWDYSFWIVGYPPLNKQYISTVAIKHSSEVLTARGYHARNMAIVDDCEKLLAFPNTMKQYSHSGTWFTINYARETKRKLKIFYPDGSVVDE